MESSYHSLLKHSAVYGLAQIVSRLASFVLLPVYTRYLLPADYGILALLDLTTSLLSVLLSRGLIVAVLRYHFEARTEAERSQVWWTGLSLLLLITTVIIVPVWLARTNIAHLTLGLLPDASLYYSLALATLWLNTLGEFIKAELRARKKSGLYVSIALTHLLFNIGLNLSFLIVFQFGIFGILLGNLVAGGLRTLILGSLFLRTQGQRQISWPLVHHLQKFAAPVVITAFLSLLMHQADRYVLRLFLDLEQVGIYSVAYTFGQAINTLVMVPFAAIWDVEMYTIAKKSQAKQIYATVFQYFVYGVSTIMLGAALFAQPLLTMILPSSYAGAGRLIPLICLAYIFFSLHQHFRVPALLAKRPIDLLPAAIAAAATNIGLNLLLIPRWGIYGAAWASVCTFIVFSFTGLWVYRSIDRYPYPLLRCGLILAGMIASYLAYHLLTLFFPSSHWTFGIAAGMWLAWSITLFGPLFWRLLNTRERGLVRAADPCNVRQNILHTRSFSPGESTL